MAQWQTDEREGVQRDGAVMQQLRLMLGLCSKDSPAVPWISPCAYVIRLHGTMARPAPMTRGMQDELEGMGWDG